VALRKITDGGKALLGKEVRKKRVKGETAVSRNEIKTKAVNNSKKR